MILGCVKRYSDWQFIEITTEWDLRDFLEMVIIEQVTDWVIVDSENKHLLTKKQAFELIRGDNNVSVRKTD